jgi:small subunit ribosomal protein S6
MVILDPYLKECIVAPSLDQYLNVIRTAGGSMEKLDFGFPPARVRDQ